ncbi:MAG: hypothetical protein JW787_04030 [Sedimentisphaerales bacterium]|nr:hypothetical protein [Sedimentisphaerales bacterium]
MLTELYHNNTECKSEDHDKHLCYLTSQGFNLSDPDEFKALTDNPQFRCQHCGRKANSDNNLCAPVPI